jgi:hypothetical protein
MPEINLPTKPKPAVQLTPRRTILFSKPKTGKTVTVSKLPKCLILDFEKGTLAIDALSYQIKSVKDVFDVCVAIKKAEYPYTYIAIDTASALEEMCHPEAERRWASSKEGAKWFLTDEKGNLHPQSGKATTGSILNLGFGKGHALVAEVFTEVITMVEKCAPKLIILAHSTYATITKEGSEFSSLDIMLGKKSKFAATFRADAIGYIYRKGTQNFVNFTASEDVGAGGRHRYLEKEHILLSEWTEDKDGNEELVTYWDSIYAPKNSKSTKKETPKDK